MVITLHARMKRMRDGFTVFVASMLFQSPQASNIILNVHYACIKESEIADASIP